MRRSSQRGRQPGVGIQVAQYFYPLIGGGQQIETAAELACREARPHIFDLLIDLDPVVIVAEIGLELADRGPILCDLLVVGLQLRIELPLAL